ncbi:MAG: SH3 domain-containing protein [Chloroflexi bacterium]|nr:SH3 domain-containing protein [Chloroflexota bacterium]
MSSDIPSGQTGKAMEELRDILLSRYRERVAELEAELDDLKRRVADEDALIATITPIIGEAIRRKIRDSREEMIEALYPIIAQTVIRAVSEAIRDLARTVDARMRTTFTPRRVWRRLWARLSGVSGAEMALRESLPFDVEEVFLIHRESGLLLWHVSSSSNVSPDTDLISGMLTAIRDFARDAFGQGEEGQLDEIQYSDLRILIEPARHAYLAVVVAGVEPPGFRAEMRERIIAIEHAYEEYLRAYDGDQTPLVSVEESLRSLFVATQSRDLTPGQKRVLVGLFGLVAVCVVTLCVGGWWLQQTLRTTPVASVTVEATPTPTFTWTPSPTATAIPSPTSSATPVPTATSRPTVEPTATPAPVYGAMTGSEWVHEGPSMTSPRTGVILRQGQPVEILAQFDSWYLVRWVHPGGDEMRGWVLAQWIGTTDTIPARIVTPAPGR